MGRWFDGQDGVPFGDRRYDAGLGGSHDRTVLCTPNTPVTAIAAGHISDLSYPSWGAQVCIKLDAPEAGHLYMALGLHMAAINPALSPNEHLQFGDLIGWSGGCTSSGQYAGTSNPTGRNFLNAPFMSSQPQNGIALHDGVAYGGAGWSDWTGGRPIDFTLDPSRLLALARATPVGPPAVIDPGLQDQANDTWDATAAMLKTCYGSYANIKSGMHTIWEAAYLSRRVNPGPPITLEVEKYHNWAGLPVLCQWYANGYRIEYVNGNGAMYDGLNRQVYP